MNNTIENTVTRATGIGYHICKIDVLAICCELSHDLSIDMKPLNILIERLNQMHEIRKTTDFLIPEK